MIKEVLYLYLGTNGTILSPVHLEDTYYSRRIRLTAEDNKKITKNGKDLYLSKIIPEDELDQWYEV